MRIIVPIKQVPETGDVRMDPETGTMVREGVAAVVNPLDLYAIQVAVNLRDGVALSGDSRAGDSRSGERADAPPPTGGHVKVVSMGPQKAIAAIREAVAMGCDDGVLLSDRAFRGSDTWATSYTIAQAIRKLGPFDLVICGERATDGDTGQVGPEIAAWLDLPVLTYVSRISRIDDHAIEAERLIEEGYQRVRANLPAVLTVVKEIARPDLPTLRGKKRARRMDISVWDRTMLDATDANLGLAGSPTRVVSIRTPKVARQGETVVVDDATAADAAIDRLLGFLDRRGLVDGCRP